MKRKFLFAVLVLLTSLKTFSQNITIDPTNAFAKCPNEWLVYTATNSPSTSACTFTWTVTNGEIEAGSTNGNTSTFTGGNLVRIRWTDVTTAGSIKVQTLCNPTDGNGTVTVAAAILSLNNVNPGALSGPASVTMNTTTNQTYSVPDITFPSIGTADPNPKKVDSYEWQIPAGWTVVSGGNTKSIVVKPDNCTGGIVRVRGKNTTCNLQTLFSNWSSPITVTRTLGTPGAITGKTKVVCTDQTATSYSVSNVSGATSYVWTLPNGWTGTSSTNTITVTPNGLNGGSISVKAVGCAVQSAASSLTIGIDIIDPNNPLSITNNRSGFVCNSLATNFNLVNSPPDATVTWSATPSQVFVTPTGTGTTATLTGNTVSSTATITYTVTRACGTVTKSASFWVGTPMFSSIIYDGVYGPYPDCSTGNMPYTSMTDHTIETINGGSTSTTFSLNANGTVVSGPLNSTKYGFISKSTSANFTINMSTSNTCGNKSFCLYFSNTAGPCPLPTINTVKINNVTAPANCTTNYTYNANTDYTITATSGGTPITFSMSPPPGVTGTLVSAGTYKVRSTNTTASFVVSISTTSMCGTVTRCLYFSNTPGNPLSVGPEQRVTVFPNPASDLLTIQLENETSLTSENALTTTQPFEVKLLNRFGQTVYTGRSSTREMKISVKGLPQDIYYLVVVTKDATIRKQILISR